MTLHSCPTHHIYIQAITHPSHPALRCYIPKSSTSPHLLLPFGNDQAGEVKELGYAQVWGMARRIARVLAVKGGTGRVGIAVDEGPFLPILILAVLMMKSPTALVPLDANDPRLHLLLDDAQPSIVIAKDEEDAARIRAAGTDLKVLSVEEVWGLVGGQEMGEEDEEWDRKEGWGHHPSHIYFTSGSTGRPKGCILTRSNLTAYALHHPLLPHVSAHPTFFLASAHTFDPLLGDIMGAWVAGGTVACTTRNVTSVALGHVIGRLGAEGVCSTPAVWGTVLPRDVWMGAQEAGYSVPPLAVVALGGEPTSARIISTWTAPTLVPDESPWTIKLLNIYGVTECCVYQTVSTLGSTHPRKAIGQPIGQTRICVMGVKGSGWEALRDTAWSDLTDVTQSSTPSQFGELCLSGPQIGTGYLNRPSLSTSRFLDSAEHGPLFRTGDIVQYTAAGHWVFVGRLDTQIKINGQRVDLEEIEHVIAEQGAGVVGEVCVVYRQDGLICFVVPGVDLPIYFPGSRHDEDEDWEGGIHAHPPTPGPAGRFSTLIVKICEDALPGYMVPARVVVVQALPRTRTGKVSRKVLAESSLPDPIHSFENDSDDDDSSDDDHGGWSLAVKQTLTSILSLSPTTPIRSSTTFTSLGCDSLTAVRVVKALARLYRPQTTEEEGVFGELMGVFLPAEVGRCRQVGAYVAYLRRAVGELGGDGVVVGQGVEKVEEDGWVMDLVIQSAGLTTTPSLGLLSHLLHRLPVKHPHLILPSSSNIETTALLILHNLLPVTRSTLHMAVSSLPSPALVAILSGRVGLTCSTCQISRSALSSHASTALVTGQSGPDMQTALHVAARAGAAGDVMDALLDGTLPAFPAAASTYCTFHPGATPPRSPYTALLSTKDAYGRTPLHWSVINGHTATTSHLLHRIKSAGVDVVGVRDGQGETAKEMAERRARCGDAGRGGLPPSVFAGLAGLVGGSGRTASVKKYI
ncbi:hypothetical protein DFS34DRAFT_628037 [Phlyctochytrium arcticum]|nr:hypothetical protein DFS34DRAFT_628037 [Phlyctochytrium arcticum]